jgi:hypothetical protein
VKRHTQDQLYDLLGAIRDATVGMADWRVVAVHSAAAAALDGRDPDELADELRDFMAQTPERQWQQLHGEEVAPEDGAEPDRAAEYERTRRARLEGATGGGEAIEA